MERNWICDECENVNGGDWKYCKACGAKKSRYELLHSKKTIMPDELIKDKWEEKGLCELPKNQKEVEMLDQLLEKKKEVTSRYDDKQRTDSERRRILHIILFIIYGIIDFMLLNKVEFFDTTPDIITGWIIIIGGAGGGCWTMEYFMKESKSPYYIKVLLNACVGVFGAIYWGIVTLIAMIIPWSIMSALF